MRHLSLVPSGASFNLCLAYRPRPRRRSRTRRRLRAAPPRRRPRTGRPGRDRPCPHAPHQRPVERARRRHARRNRLEAFHHARRRRPMSALRACAHDAASDQVLDWLKSGVDGDAPTVQLLETRLRREGQRDWSAWCAFVAQRSPQDARCCPSPRPSKRRAPMTRSRPLAEWLRALRELLKSQRPVGRCSTKASPAAK